MSGINLIIQNQIKKAFDSLNKNEYSNALNAISICIKLVANKRYNNKSQDTGVKDFLKDEQDLLFGFSTQNLFKVGSATTVKLYDDLELHDIIYNEIIIHHSKKIKIDNKKIILGSNFGIGRTIIGNEVIDLKPNTFLISNATILALIFSVICAKENADLDFRGQQVSLFNWPEILLEDYKGKKKEFIEMYSLRFIK